jgi:hypothetical protein
MRTTRTLALAGAAGVLTTPAAIAMGADHHAAPATDAGHLRAELADHPTVRAQMRGAEHEKLLRRYRRLAKAAGEHHSAARFWSNGRLRTDIRRLRNELRSRGAASTASTTGAGAATPQLASIAACESGGNPRAIGGGGAFRGKYQFTYASWAAVGGHGDPAAAPEAEQDRRAAMLMTRSGAGNWPVCG